MIEFRIFLLLEAVDGLFSIVDAQAGPSPFQDVINFGVVNEVTFLSGLSTKSRCHVPSNGMRTKDVVFAKRLSAMSGYAYLSLARACHLGRVGRRLLLVAYHFFVGWVSVFVLILCRRRHTRRPRANFPILLEKP